MAYEIVTYTKQIVLSCVSYVATIVRGTYTLIVEFCVMIWIEIVSFAKDVVKAIMPAEEMFFETQTEFEEIDEIDCVQTTPFETIVVNFIIKNDNFDQVLKLTNELAKTKKQLQSKDALIFQLQEQAKKSSNNITAVSAAKQVQHDEEIKNMQTEMARLQTQVKNLTEENKTLKTNAVQTDVLPAAENTVVPNTTNVVEEETAKTTALPALTREEAKANMLIFKKNKKEAERIAKAIKREEIITFVVNTYMKEEMRDEAMSCLMSDEQRSSALSEWKRDMDARKNKNIDTTVEFEDFKKVVQAFGLCGFCYQSGHVFAKCGHRSPTKNA